MKKSLILTFLVIAMITIGADYCFYHDSTAGRETAFFISNLSDEKAYFRVVVYSSEGKELWKNTYRTNPYETILVDLSKLISPRSDAWGLVLVQSDQLLVVSVSYTSNGTLFARDTVMESVHSSKDAKYYWYATYYENIQKIETDLMILNTSSRETDVYVWIYDFQGRILKELSGSIKPRASAYINIASELDSDAIGVIDIRSTELLVIAVDYIQEGVSWAVKNVVDWYTTTDW